MHNCSEIMCRRQAQYYRTERLIFRDARHTPNKLVRDNVEKIATRIVAVTTKGSTQLGSTVSNCRTLGRKVSSFVRLFPKDFERGDYEGEYVLLGRLKALGHCKGQAEIASRDKGAAM
jgi:hypothetical protein